jgi:hypothetical protein
MTTAAPACFLPSILTFLLDLFLLDYTLLPQSIAAQRDLPLAGAMPIVSARPANAQNTTSIPCIC